MQSFALCRWTSVDTGVRRRIDRFRVRLNVEVRQTRPVCLSIRICRIENSSLKVRWRKKRFFGSFAFLPSIRIIIGIRNRFGVGTLHFGSLFLTRRFSFENVSFESFLWTRIAFCSRRANDESQLKSDELMKSICPICRIFFTSNVDLIRTKYLFSNRIN